MLRSYIPKSIKYNWKFGLSLIIIFTAVRFYIVLNTNLTNDYGPVSMLFAFMALLPFILLNREGRRYIGITKPKNYWWLILSLLIGIAISSLIYLIFTAFYDHSISNAMVYISNSYQVVELNDSNKFTFFIIFAITSMIYSPLGEELFYRGLIHGSFAKDFGENKASIIDSLAFALAHLSHFGVIYYLGGWSFLPIPALIWFIGMFILSRAFLICKQKSGSILGAIIGHSGFNLAMIYWIFYHIF